MASTPSGNSIANVVANGGGRRGRRVDPPSTRTARERTPSRIRRRRLIPRLRYHDSNLNRTRAGRGGRMSFSTQSVQRRARALVQQRGPRAFVAGPIARAPSLPPPPRQRGSNGRYIASASQMSSSASSSLAAPTAPSSSHSASSSLAAPTAPSSSHSASSSLAALTAPSSSHSASSSLAAPTAPSSQFMDPGSNTDPTVLTAEYARLHSAYVALHLLIRCPVCWDNNSNYVLRCGHRTCGHSLPACPICRGTAQQPLRTF